ADAGRLKTQLVTKKPFAGFIAGKFNPLSIEEDCRRLTEYYHGLGFLAVQITPEVVRSADINHVTIVYHIVEGLKHHVADVGVENLHSVPLGQAQKWMELKPGATANGYVMQADAKRIADGLGYRGIQAGVDPQVYDVPGQPGLVQVQY